MKAQVAADAYLYRKDRLLLMQRGVYSDKFTVGLFRVLIDFDACAAIERCKEVEKPEDGDNHYYDGSEFVKHMLQTGCLEELEYDVLHTGYYGSLEAS